MKFFPGSTIRPEQLAGTIGWLAVVLLCAAPTAYGQSRVRFPTAADPYATQGQPWSAPVPQLPGATGTYPAPTYPSNAWPPSMTSPLPAASSAPYIPPSVGTYPAPGASLGPQIMPFDPYAAPQSIPTVPPLVNTPGGPSPVLPLPPASLPPSLPPSSFPGAAPVYPPASGSPLGPPPPLNGSAGGNIPQPTPMFPNGINWNGAPQRLFQDTGFRYTFLNGDSGDDLEIHEVDVFTTMVINRWGRSPTGLRITPGMTLDFLDGPATGSDLPAHLYAAYVQGAWAPQFTPQFGADLVFRAGVYSDFDTVTFHSIRFTGIGLGVLQFTPTVAMKLGVEYLDRARIKILPAGGILWTPDPQSRYDIYFPRPKLARYWRTFGNADVWWHVGGEYGGGSWTIDRPDDPMAGASERIDINDLRIFTGVEWNQANYRTGILEIGYVFDREVFYKVVPTDTMSPSNTVMIRGGVSF